MPKPLATTTIQARFWKAGDDTLLPQDAVIREVTLELRPYTSKYAKKGEQVVQMIGGPTGYESFIVTPESAYGMTRNGWLACAGSHVYERCDVTQIELYEGLQALGLIE